MRSRLSTNTATLRVMMRKALRDTEAELAAIIKENAERLRADLEETTPKATGKAAKAWTVESGIPSSSEGETGQTSGGKTRNGDGSGHNRSGEELVPVVSVQNQPGGGLGTVTVTNPLPYVVDLEKGTTGNAAGFFTAACRDCEARVEQAIKRMQNRRYE